MFRRLFRGRDDVYPKLWINPNKERKGYAPACSNEWAPGICEKPRVKCGDCRNQAFIPVGDQVILDHLQGRHVIGVYPLLKDETCWLLAADFDKSTWREDVAAFLETCRSYSMPAAVERSRSGNGAHVWFFFSAPVAAAVARRMGCFLLTETMAHRHQLAMTSYDRLFPNQDTMPRGGFGNLIALPLQHGPRQQGNTLFLDGNLEPRADQWAHLAAYPPIDPAVVKLLADEASRQGRVIGVRLAVSDDPTDHAPWERTPSGRPPKRAFSGSLPAVVGGVQSQRLFVEKGGLPSALLNEIKRLAAFQNPEFYKKQSLRLSTATTPRVIACAEEFPEHIALPRGCLGELQTLLKGLGIALGLSDQRESGAPLAMKFQGQLTGWQQDALRAMESCDLGIVVAPPGTGKTVLGAALIAARGRSTLVLVHRKPLLEQWVDRLAFFLGIDPKEIGRAGGGANRLNGRLDVAMMQSLLQREAVNDSVAGYGHVVVDECHHVPAVSVERLLKEVKARFVTGLTATPYRRDGHQPILEMQCGPVRCTAGAARRPDGASMVMSLRIRDTAFQVDGAVTDAGIQALYAALAGDTARNAMICADTIEALRVGRTPLVLTERRDHLDALVQRLQPAVKHLIVLRGGMPVKARRTAMARIAEIPDDEPRLLLATGRYIGEGFDDPRLDTLFLALPIAWKGTLIQYAGRLQRPYPGKKEVRIYDYVDRLVAPLACMFGKRLRGYRDIGYEVEPAMPGLPLTLIEKDGDINS